jgi:hypothetical protein
VEDSIYYCSLTNYTGIGLTAGGTFELAIRLKPAQLGPFAGYNIIALIFYHYDGTSTGGYAKIYDQGSATQPGPVLNSTAYTGGITGWQRIDLSAPVAIGGTTDLWCSVEVTHPSGGFPGGCDAGPTIVDADWIYFSGAWGTLGGYGLPYNWQLLAIVEAGGPSNQVRWDYETGLQGWTHTNGQSFPQGWAVMDSHLHGNNWICPIPDDSSLWVDDDAAGGNAYIYQDSILSPILVPDTNTDWLSYGLGYNFRTAGEWLESGLKYYNGSTWNTVQLAVYTADMQQVWDSVDVSAYKTYPRIQVYFYYDDGGGRGWYGAVDNVTINGTLYGIEETETGRVNGSFGFAAGNATHVQGYASISYVVDRSGLVSLKAYDRTGALVATLVNRNVKAGLNTAHWDCSSIPAGVYFLQLETQGNAASVKLVVVK